MKSRTSFFNPYVFKKDITRFVPVWLLFTVYLGLTSLPFTSLRSPQDNAEAVTAMLGFMVIPTMLYAAICALTLFGDLFVPKMCNALHALPLRRECWFCTHVTAGLLFFLVPWLLKTLLSLPHFSGYEGYLFIMLGGVFLQFLYFFGLMLLCVFCTGNRFGALSLYAIIHFLPMLIYSVIDLFYCPLLPGVSLSSHNFTYFTPLIQLMMPEYILASLFGSDSALSTMEMRAWRYLITAAGTGILMGIIALFLYRKRKLERAGDLLIFRCLHPLYILICSVGTCMLFYSIFGIFGDSSLIPLLLGLLVGFFISQMLLRRTVKVFQLKTLIRFGILVVILLATMGITYLDPLGIATHIPDVENIRSGDISFTTRYGDPNLETSSEAIEQITQIHKQLIKDHELGYTPSYYDEDEETVGVTVRYTLLNGREFLREYYVDKDSKSFRKMEAYMSGWSYVIGSYSKEKFTNLVTSAHVDRWQAGYYDVNIPKEYIPSLMDAIALDCEEGTMAQDWFFHPDPYKEDSRMEPAMELSFEYPFKTLFDEGVKVKEIFIYPTARNTCALLEQILAETSINDFYA